jgi:hypothetical protein
MILRRLFLVLAIISLSASADSTSPPNCFDQSIEPSELRRNVSNASLKDFERLQAGMKREIVVEAVGDPTYLCGSGIAYDVYVLQNGREVWIAYPSGTTGWASITIADGTKGKIVFNGSSEN